MKRRPAQIVEVRGPDGVDEVLARLEHGPLAVDTETTGLSWRADRVGGVCLAAGDTAIFAHRGGLAPVVRWLARQVKRERPLVFHHAKFDMHHLFTTFGLHIAYPVHDTMLQSHLLDNRGAVAHHRGVHGGHSLKGLAKVHIDPRADDAEKELLRDIRAKGGKHKGDWMLASPKLYVKYSALDPWYTLQLHTLFLARIRAWQQPEGYPSLLSLYRTEQWVTLALRDMERRGVQVDRSFLEQWRDQLEIESRDALHTLNRVAGYPTINWNSAPQLRTLLFGSRAEGGLELHNGRRTKGGDASTDKRSLTTIAHPIGEALLRYRKVAKQHGTFAVGLLKAATADNVIHPHFNQNVDTGRMSCSDPNLQQQDRTSGVRKAFVPRKGLVLRHADYSQIEMRIAVHEANERTLINGFCTDPKFDMHAATAGLMFGTTTPTSDQRTRGKTENFAALYGQGIDAKTEALMLTITGKEARRACLEMGCSPSPGEPPHRALAELLTGRYHQVMPHMRAAIRAMEQNTRRRGFAMNRYGRHRYLDERDAYKSFNTSVQGSAADCGKVGIAMMYRELQLGRGDLAMLVQVHDEIIYESDGDPRVDQRVLECLNDYQTFRVPIVAEISGSRKSWQDKKPITFT